MTSSSSDSSGTTTSSPPAPTSASHLSAATDHVLLQRLATGDREAFACFYDRYAPRVLGLILKIVHRRADAEDVLQETFFQVWTRADRFDATRSAPRVWLFLLARSRAIDHLRRAASAHEAVAAAGQLRIGAPAPSADLQLSETQTATHTALDQLPDEQAIAVRMAFFEGLSHSQVAHRLGLALGTVKTRIRRGMQRLRELLLPAQETLP